VVRVEGIRRRYGQHLAYKPEHAVDLDTGAIVAAPIHPAEEGDVATLTARLKAAAENLAEINLAPKLEKPCALIAHKGYHSRDAFKDLADSVWKTRIVEPKPAKGAICVGMAKRRRARPFAPHTRPYDGLPDLASAP